MGRTTSLHDRKYLCCFLKDPKYIYSDFLQVSKVKRSKANLYLRGGKTSLVVLLGHKPPHNGHAVLYQPSLQVSEQSVCRHLYVHWVWLQKMWIFLLSFWHFFLEPLHVIYHNVTKLLYDESRIYFVCNYEHGGLADSFRWMWRPPFPPNKSNKPPQCNF